MADINSLVRKLQNSIRSNSTAEVATTSPAFTESADQNARSETILLVEDEHCVRFVTRELLENAGYTILDACDPVEAINLFDKHEGQIDLLLTDIVMPGMNGRDLARTLKHRAPGLKTLFISGYTENMIVRHEFLDPNNAYLQKPYTVEGLTRKVREVIGSPAKSSSRPKPPYSPALIFTPVSIEQVDGDQPASLRKDSC